MPAILKLLKTTLIGVLEDQKGFDPALVQIEEALAPCFIIERHEGGLCTVFIPSAPTLVAGSIQIIAETRVHPIHSPVTTLLKCVTKWGTGSGELLAALPKYSSPRLFADFLPRTTYPMKHYSVMTDCIAYTNV